MRFRLRTLLIVLAMGPPVLAPAMMFAHRRYTARVAGLRMWQQFSPNTRLVRPAWWIFETTPTYELPPDEAASFGYAAPIPGTTSTLVK